MADNGFSTTKGFEFTVTGAEYDEDEGELNRVLLKTDDVPARPDRETGEIAVKPRVRKQVGTRNGVPVFESGQKPDADEIPDHVAQIAIDAQEEEVFCEATVTELDRSQRSDMDGEDKIYFISPDNVDTLTQKILSQEETAEQEVIKE